MLIFLDYYKNTWREIDEKKKKEGMLNIYLGVYSYNNRFTIYYKVNA